MSMSVRELISLGEKRLTESGITDAGRDSKSLYCYVVGIPENKLFMEYQYTVQDMLCERYFNLIERRSEGEPLQYIVGIQEFMGLKFKVDPRVLIPRMDTEVLVENALSIINDGTLAKGYQADYSITEQENHYDAKTEQRKKWEVLDLCTGSGAIGISVTALTKNQSDKIKINMTLSDISKEALSLAKENAVLNGVENKVKTVQGDLFTPFKKFFGKQKFDMIISNPPYIKTSVLTTLQKEIWGHEPMMALDGGADGLDFYRRIISEAPDYLNPRGILLMEIGSEQGEAVKNLLSGVGLSSEKAAKEQKPKFTSIKIIKDLTGSDRVVFSLYEG